MRVPLSSLWLLAALPPLGAGARVVRADAVSVSEEPIGKYMRDLEASHRLTAETVSLETLKEALRIAEDRFIHDDARGATSLLFGVVESPRYLTWKDTPSYQNAEFLLGRALLRGSATLSAERYLLRVLAHGTEAPYFVPAHRALVDLALDTRDYARLLKVLDAVAPLSSTTLPKDSRSERAYLQARVAYDAGDWNRAADRFAA